MLPFVKPSFGILCEEKNLWFYLSKLIEGIFLLYQLANNTIPFLLDILRQLLVIPTCLLLQIGHHKQDAVDKPVAGAFTFSQLVQDFLLDSTNDDMYGRLMKMELLAFLRSDIVVLALNTDSQNCSSEPLL